MILCHSKFLPPMPRLQKIISCLWLQSINRYPANVNSGGKKAKYAHKMVKNEMFTQIVLDQQITIYILWEFGMLMWTGVNPEITYLASQKKIKHLRNRLGDAHISYSFTICDWTYHNSQNTVTSLISCPSVARCLIRTPALEVSPRLTAKMFQKTCSEICY